MAVSLSANVLSWYERFSLYNSPYVAHGRGCAVDLYPDPEAEIARSPVAGEVLDTKTVNAPPKPYAAAHDHLILIDCEGYVARTLHVDPAVEPGDRIEVGDPLGRLVRAGFFAPWVNDHIHLGFRAPNENPCRASGSLSIVPEVRPRALRWDGSGTVVESAETYVILNEPAHPEPGTFAGIAASIVPDGSNGATDDGNADADGDESSETRVMASGSSAGTALAVLDGGLPHYDGGGTLPAGTSRASDASDTTAPSHDPNASDTPETSDGRIEFLNTEIGVATDRNVAWHPVSVRANGRPITGLSLFCARDQAFGAKLVCPEVSFERGERVTVSIHRGA